MYTIALLAAALTLVSLWLLYGVVRRWIERDEKRLDAAETQRRRPPTMPPRRPPHVSTMPFGAGPRLAESDVHDDMLRQVRERFNHTIAAHQYTVIADTGNAGLDAILNAPEPDPATLTMQQLAEAYGVPARMLRSGSIMGDPRVDPRITEMLKHQQTLTPQEVAARAAAEMAKAADAELVRQRARDAARQTPPPQPVVQRGRCETSHSSDADPMVPFWIGSTIIAASSFSSAPSPSPAPDCGSSFDFGAGGASW